MARQPCDNKNRATSPQLQHNSRVRQMFVVTDVGCQNDEHHAPHHQHHIQDLVLNLLPKEQPPAYHAEQDARALRRHSIAHKQELQAPEVQEHCQQLARHQARDQGKLICQQPACVSNRINEISIDLHRCMHGTVPCMNAPDRNVCTAELEHVPKRRHVLEKEVQHAGRRSHGALHSEVGGEGGRRRHAHLVKGGCQRPEERHQHHDDAPLAVSQLL